MWNQRKNVKTVPIDASNNCFTFRTCTGMEKYQSFDREFQKEKMSVSERCMICFDASNDPLLNEKDDDDRDLDNVAEDVEQPDDRIETINLDLGNELDRIDHDSKLYDESDTMVKATSPEAELLRWHYRLGHVSFKKLRAMALLGIIPKYLSKVKQPVCAGCLYGTMTRRPWRSKKSKDAKPSKVFVASAAGQCISVDQM